MIYKILLLANIIFSVCAQFMLKFGMKRIGLVEFGSGFLPALKKMANSPFIWLALVFFGTSFVLYAIVLSKLELSRSYPIALIGVLILTTLISFFFLDESLGLFKVLGLTFSTLGIIFLLL